MPRFGPGQTEAVSSLAQDLFQTVTVGYLA